MKILPSKPRILISGALPPPMGGVGMYYQTLLNSSLPERVDLTFVQTSSNKRELSTTGRVSLFNLKAALLDCWRFTRAVLEAKPQITDIGTAPGLSFVKHSYCVLIAKILGSRVLLHPHCSLLVVYQEKSKWWQWYFKKVIHLTNGIVALSKEWLQLYAIIKNTSVYYLPNAIDLRQYRDIAEQRLATFHSGRPCVVLYLGYLGRAKGSFDLLDAAVELRSKGVDFIFNLVGGDLTPGELDLLREKMKELRIEEYVNLCSAAYGTDKYNYLRYADIFVYPSHHEGMPMAVIEAMACGLPVVATRVGGLPDLIQDGVNGILVEPEKPAQLAAGLGKLAGDDDLRNSMQKVSYQFANDRYDIETHVTQLVAIYEKALSDSARGKKQTHANQLFIK